MSSVQLFGLVKCSTCQKALAWLREKGIDHHFTDYRDHPVAPALLVQWAGQVGGWEKLVNRASMTWRNLPDDRKSPASEDDWLALIAQYPALIRRPVTVLTAGQVAVGFSEKKYGELFA